MNNDLISRKALLEIVRSKMEEYALSRDEMSIYHYSNLGVCSWYDFTQMIQQTANALCPLAETRRHCDIRPCLSSQYPSPVKRPSYSVLDKTKIQEAFHLDIPYWTDSLRQCIANLLK